MIAGRTVGLIVCLSVVCGGPRASAGPASAPATRPAGAKGSPAHWLAKAAADITRVKARAVRTFLLEQLALAQGRTGDVRGAMAVASKLPPMSRALVMEALVVQQAAEDLPGACASAKTIPTEVIRHLAISDLVAIEAETDPASALKRAEGISEPYRSRALLALVEKYIVVGDLKAARKIGRKVVAKEYKDGAANYVLAATTVAAKKDCATAAGHRAFVRAEFEYALSAMALARAKAGRFDEARKLADEITWVGQRAWAYVGLAGELLTAGKTVPFGKVLARAVAGSARVEDPGSRIMLALSIAQLQVQAKRFAAAVKTIEDVWEDLEEWDDGCNPGIENAAELLIRAGKADRVRKQLERRDELNDLFLYGLVKALAGHYAATGRTKQLDALLATTCKRPRDRAEAYLGAAVGLHQKRKARK